MFSKLTKKLFYNYDKEKSNEGLIKMIDDIKVVLVMDYIYLNTGLNGICNTMLEHMIIECGYTPNSDKNKTNVQFRNILDKLKRINIIETEYDLLNIKPKQFFTLKLNMTMDNNFIQLFDTEKEIILNQTIKQIDNVKLIVYYCYIKAAMYKRKEKEHLYIGGKPEVCYFGYKDVNNNLGLSASSIKIYNDILVELNLIRIDNAGLWYYSNDINKKPCESNNIYAFFKDGWEDEIKEGILRYRKMKNDRVFLNTRKYKKNNKSNNGYISRIKELEKEGKASTLQINRKNKLISEKSEIGEANITYEIVNLLNIEENKDKLLSVIYSDQGKSNYSDIYQNIENKLKLYDFDNDEWLID